MSSELETTLRSLAEASLLASRQLATLSRERKDAFLRRLADCIDASHEALTAANELDLAAGAESGLSSALLDRLRLTPKRLAGMSQGVREVAALPDPVGEEIERTTRPNGLLIRKVRVPIGVIGIVYESRPNVTIDCAALCFKSGNASLLRGGKEAFHSNRALAALIAETLAAEGLPPAAVQLVPTTDRAALHALLKMDDCIHCLIPRGGEGLIRMVAENARMPVIKHYKGVCCLYLDEAADPAMAESITLNAKTQRPGVCNAIENLFLDEAYARAHWPALAARLAAAGVEIRANGLAQELLEGTGTPVTMATEEDFETEYLDLILSVRTVSGVAGAIDAINQYGSQHSDGIVTTNEAAAIAFQQGVDSATVYWNASTRFTDGYEFGLGAEIGISTDKLHARGPMGLRELTTYKFLLTGTGQIRA